MFLCNVPLKCIFINKPATFHITMVSFPGFSQCSFCVKPQILRFLGWFLGLLEHSTWALFNLADKTKTSLH